MKRNRKYVFQYGMVDLPFDLSRENFVSTYSQAWLTGSPCTTQSATMKMFGSTAGPTKPRSEYQFWNEKKQRYSMLPRNFVSSRKGKRGEDTLKLRWVRELVHRAESIALRYATSHDPRLLEIMEEAKRIIPEELRICKSCFNAMALVGNVKYKTGANNCHCDGNDLVSIIITLGTADVIGGNTVYYGGVSKKQLGDVLHSTNFVHGQYQIGPFESIYHGGETWTGSRVVISLFLNKQVLDHFRVHGDEFYKNKNTNI
jgi:hypothetical protein